MPDPADVPIRRPVPPTPGRADGDPDPLTPEESAEVVGELLRGLRAEVGAVGREVAQMRGELRGAVSTLATHGTPAQRTAADQEQTARLGITAQQVVSAARWQAVQTLLADQAVRAGLVASGGAVVVVAAALIWYLVTGETRPPIPGVSP